MNNFVYAARTLRKNLGFSMTTILVLGLGIGGTVAIFSIVNAVLLRPLPYDHPDRIVQLWGNVQRTVVERRGGSLPDYQDWKAQSHSFDGLAAFWNATVTMRTANERLPIRSEVVGAEYFRILGVKPVMGRDFRPEEEMDSSLPPVAVLSHEMWRQRMGSDPAIVGKPLTLDSVNYTIIGVLPSGFRGIGDRAEVWVTPASLPERLRNFVERGTRGLVVLGRLAPRVSLDQAQAEMNSVSRALEQAYPGTNEKRGVEVASLVAETFGNVRPALLVLLAAVSLVLLIACANVANLMVLRLEARYAEIAVRAALGASRRELLKRVFSETLLLSAAGAVLGLLISSWAVDLVLALSPIQLPSFVNVTLDFNVIVFTTGLMVFVAVLMTIVPALQLATSDLHDALSNSSSKTIGVRSSHRVRNALVVAEVALSFVLLLTSGLLIESFRQLLSVDAGFQPSNLLTVRVGFEDQMKVKAEAVREALERLPGVQSVATSDFIPFSGGPAAFYYPESDRFTEVDASTMPRTYFHFVTPGFFRTMGMTLRSGRDFTPDDGEQVVIVSEKVVQRFWPGQDPIGKRLRIGRDNPWMNIVGVVGETRMRGLPENPTPDPDIYLTFSRFGGNPGMLIRTAVEPGSLIPTVINEIKRVDKMAVIVNAATMEDLMRPGLARARFLSSVSGIFSGMALVLALVGIYGSISYAVAQRTREFGIRIALGANRSAVLRLVLSRSLLLVGGGIVLGLIASFFASRVISSLLIGITATAPSVFLITALLMIATGVGAASIPARRATRIDPLNALRQD